MLCGENYELRAGNKGHRSLTPKEQAANVLHFGRPFFISPDPHCELENDSSSTANLTGSSVRTPSLPSKTECPHHARRGAGMVVAGREDTLCPAHCLANAPAQSYWKKQHLDNNSPDVSYSLERLACAHTPKADSRPCSEGQGTFLTRPTVQVVLTPSPS